MLIYLDWNVFDRLEKRERFEGEERERYFDIFNFLQKESVYTPYSNAHLRDLLRGYKKNPKYIEGHFKIIEELTKNLCFCQYWEKKNVSYHFRSVRDFFFELEKDQSNLDETYDELLENVSSSYKLIIQTKYKSQPVDKVFKKVFSEDPIFNLIFARTKKEMNVYALASDLYNISVLIKRDYSIYRNLRKYILKAHNKLRKNPQLYKDLAKLKGERPNYLDLHVVLEEFAKETEVKTRNPNYNKIVNTFFRHDLAGYKSDNKFPNMFDDCTHTFYAAHCDFFITNDDRCQYKALKTYERLGIETKVFTAEEFVKSLTL